MADIWPFLRKKVNSEYRKLKCSYFEYRAQSLYDVTLIPLILYFSIQQNLNFPNIQGDRHFVRI